MRKYDTLLSAIETNFSAESGASLESLDHFMDRIKQNSEWRRTLIAELLEGLRDQDFSWREALWDDYCHVVDADSEEQARSFLVEDILPRLKVAEQEASNE